RFTTAFPSIVAAKSVTLSIQALAQSCRCCGVSPWNGNGSKDEHSTLTIGKNSAVPAGMVQSTAGGPPNRNQTLPDCPFEQGAPATGLSGVGSMKNHSHHSTLNTSYVLPNGGDAALELPVCRGTWPGIFALRDGTRNTVEATVRIREPRLKNSKNSLFFI